MKRLGLKYRQPPWNSLVKAISRHFVDYLTFTYIYFFFFSPFFFPKLLLLMFLHLPDTMYLQVPDSKFSLITSTSVARNNMPEESLGSEMLDNEQMEKVKAKFGFC